LPVEITSQVLCIISCVCREDEVRCVNATLDLLMVLLIVTNTSQTESQIET